MRAIHEPSPQPRRIIPALGALYDALSPLALPMIRVTAGLLLLPHGCQKLFGWFGGKGMQGTAQLSAGSSRSIRAWTRLCTEPGTPAARAFSSA